VTEAETSPCFQRVPYFRLWTLDPPLPLSSPVGGVSATDSTTNPHSENHTPKSARPVGHANRSAPPPSAPCPSLAIRAGMTPFAKSSRRSAAKARRRTTAHWSRAKS